MASQTTRGGQFHLLKDPELIRIQQEKIQSDPDPLPPLLTTLRLSTSGLPIKIIKIYNIRGPYVMCQLEYLWNGRVKDGVNANLV